jgi:hypothetical protein
MQLKLDLSLDSVDAVVEHLLKEANPDVQRQTKL